MSSPASFSGRLCGCSIPPAEIARYRSLCKTSPQQVVDAIRVDPNHPLANENYHSAIAAISAMVAHDEEAPPSDADSWNGLIDEGIIEVLVDNILQREITRCLCALRDVQEDYWKVALVQVSLNSLLAHPSYNMPRSSC